MELVLKKIGVLFVLLFLISCGDSEKKEKEQIKLGDYSETPVKVQEEAKEKAGVDLTNKGIGPVKNIKLDEQIDPEMAAKGGELFKSMCSACHKMNKKFVGPELAGVTDRRSPEWIMNMILNPEEMIKKDPIAKQLLVESNMAVMANQNLTEEEARAILEYFREFDRAN